MPLTPPPAPSWHGFDPQMVPKFAAFRVEQQFNALQVGLPHLRSQLEDVNSTIAAYRENIGHYRAERDRLRAEKAELEAGRHVPNDEELREEMARLMALPYVVGSRVDQDGCLVLLLRIQPEIHHARYDLGDFELKFQIYADAWGERRGGCRIYWIRGSQPSATRRRAGNKWDYMPQFYVSDRINDGVMGWLREHRQDESQLEACQFVALTERVITALTHFSSRPADFLERVEGDAPEYIWLDQLAQPERAARRSVALNQGGSQRRILEIDSELANYEDNGYNSIQGYERRLREYLLRKREVQAEITRLRRQAEQTEITVDPAEIVRLLNYMVQLPGVMGLKFTDEGIPVFHIRISYRLDDKRYDFGDYEVVFEDRNDSSAVVTVIKTRGPYAWYDHQEGSRPWFCFGGRGPQLQDHFRKGELGEFLHLAINTLGHVNREVDSHDYLSGRFQTIPLDYRWRNQRIRKPRRRPRRRPRTAVNEEAAAV